MSWRVRRLCATTSTVIAATIGATHLAAQGSPQGEPSEVEQLVVMIRCTLDGQESIGAGIIFGAANDRLYVVTANHVLRLGTTEATNIRVELRSLPGEPVLATLTTTFDAKRDLAVLSISGVKAAGIDVARIPFDRLGAPSSLARGDGVFALGYPQGRPWGSNVAPAPISSTSDSLITFETTLVSRGQSGGALLNQRREIVGLLLNVQPPEATARSITQVIALLREWRFPVALRGRFALAEPDVVSAGSGFTCALRRDGTAFCWGSNDHGELGNGARGSSLAPVPVSTEQRFASVSAGWSYACALTTSGAPYCWGNAQPDDAGPVPGNPMERRVPVAIGDLTLSSLSAGFAHACGVASAGAVYCWGENDDGQLGNGSKTASLTPVKAVTNVTFRSVSAGLDHSCALATDGRAYCWGGGRSGQLGRGDSTSHEQPVAVAGALRFSTLSAGNLYTCGVTTAGAGYCWGRNEFGELGDGTTKSSLVPRAVSGGHQFRTISAKRGTGRSVTCGLTINGTALCWGWESEALGQQVIDDETRPGAVVGGLSFGAISVGFSHVCGVVANGTIYCWGDGRYGQLGNGATEPHVTPGVVPIPR